MANKKENVAQNILITIFFLILFIALSYISFSRWGIVGIYSANILSYLFGKAYFVFLISMIVYWFYRLVFAKAHPLEWKMKLGFLLLNIVFLLLQGILHAQIYNFTQLNQYIRIAFPYLFKEEIFDYSAGIFGHASYVIFNSLFAKEGTILFLIIGFILSLFLLVPNQVYKKWFLKVKENYEQKKIEKKQLKAEKRATKQALKIEKNQQKAERKQMSSSFSDRFISIENKDEIQNRQSSLFMDLPLSINKEQDDKITSRSKTTYTETNVEEKSQVFSSKTNGGTAYSLPSVNLLEKTENQKKTSINKTSAQMKGERVLDILNNFGIPSELINTHIGPSVTKFEIKPDPSVKIAKILSLTDNIKMELAAKDVRIEAPIPGRNAVGIEIPNVESVPVYLRELILSLPENKQNSPLLFHLGKDLMGKAVYCELNKMPHLLIAGATGSGKSVCINTVIMSLIMRNHPDDMKMVLVDPKKVEFSPYHDIPHLLWPVITDVNLASNLLQRIVVIMDQRYDIFAEAGVKNIQGYNQYVENHNIQFKNEGTLKKMPYLVVIIDELADMMAMAGKEVELSIQRITQLARACGIHLIVATQRPSTDVITGIIKANIPSRISFAVASSIDSRTILDATGAERLLGNGDMLYFPQGESSPIRLQGAYVRDSEITKVTNYLKRQAKPDYDDTYYELENAKKGGTGSSNSSDNDSLFQEVVEYVKEAQKASTSLLQRRFGIGYNRAARLIDSLEEAGYIGPVNGSKPREVFIKNDDR